MPCQLLTCPYVLEIIVFLKLSFLRNLHILYYYNDDRDHLIQQEKTHLPTTSQRTASDMKTDFKFKMQIWNYILNRK